MRSSTEPVWLSQARKKIGLRETPGSANNPVIMAMAKDLGVARMGIAYSADSTPWCGLLVGWCVLQAGIEPPKICVRAKAWATWQANLRPEVLCPGAVLVFDREGGGHVGFYNGEDDTHYHVLGGNQSDAINIQRIAKNRCVARRWPRGVPVTGKPVKLTAKGVPVSQNEA